MMAARPVDPQAPLSPLAYKLFPFLAWRGRITPATLKADAIAGLIGGLVVLPQGVAFATLAGLPPEYGLYTAMVPAIVAALWGSSWHMVSGPTNALSLVVFAALAPLAAPGSAPYVTLALTLSLMMGAAQLAMGLARLGALVNFISHTVIVGFTAGAGLLIIASQLRHFFGIPIEAGASFFATLTQLGRAFVDFDPAITATGAVTLAVAIVARRLMPRVPYMIIAMIAGSLFGYLLIRVSGAAIPVVGPLPSALPLPSLPSFDPESWRKLAPAALALTVLGLTEAVSIARALALKSGQRIDGNQEFIGQGLSNMAGSFFSAYPSSGSFNRSGVNLEAGARTPLAAIAAAFVLAIVLFVVGPLVAWLPLAVMAALLFVVAWGLIDIAEMRRVFRANRGDAVVLAVTFVSTLTLAARVRDLRRRARVVARLPASHDASAHRPPGAGSGDAPLRPGQRGDAADSAAGHPANRRLAVLRRRRARARRAGSGPARAAGRAQHAARGDCGELRRRRRCRAAGASRTRVRDAGGALYVSGLKPEVRDVLERAGVLDAIGRDRLFESEDEALGAICPRLGVKHRASEMRTMDDFASRGTDPH